ncbi:cytochrome c oxidase subunit 4 [Actinoalloteichus hymeniacidonis]|uniref:Cytochrome c oxidase polypeptide 4 n=1 Tax=Actinoalloteichus hymeniacidonis TaxID=340345 RepID=A0AAC9MZ81_9PSEU|nr:cytochrome c oxidase subunit 4 [Actinoalloteichus hymeniacidonis]AOS65143.1 Cytochrome c oxidase subunit IV [Actinoalloteichus hymeniacidonis]MBB5906778.1 hypothetical protein [Actinoalloteichus hymeniacidonis]
MKIEAWIFEGTALFAFIVAVIYGFWAGEPVGTVALALTGGLALLVGTYFRFVSRRMKARPEDDPEAEISDGAGELGFFSPGSYWPFGLAASCALAGLALAMFHIWMLIAAGAVLLITIGGLLFEYHRAPAGH